MGGYINIIVGQAMGAGIIIFAVALIVNKFLKNIYLSVFAGYGILLLVRGLIGGFEIHIADFLAIGVVLLMFWLKDKKREVKVEE